MWDNSPQWHCRAMCPGHYSPELKAVTQLSDNLFSNTPLPHSSEHPRASPWWREATLSEITKLQGKVKTHHWLKSRTSRQSHIYGHSPLNQTFRGVLPQVAWRSTDNSSLLCTHSPGQQLLFFGKSTVQHSAIAFWSVNSSVSRSYLRKLSIFLLLNISTLPQRGKKTNQQTP